MELLIHFLLQLLVNLLIFLLTHPERRSVHGKEGPHESQVAGREDLAERSEHQINYNVILL